MRTTTWKLDNYLLALKQVDLNDSIRPFDNRSHIQVELGSAANNLYLPEFSPEQCTSPDTELIHQLYQVLRPPLQELEASGEFDWDARYGSLTAADVAKAYLLAAINNLMLKSKWQLKQQERACYKLLCDLSEALVEGKSPDQVLEDMAKKKLWLINNNQPQGKPKNI